MAALPDWLPVSRMTKILKEAWVRGRVRLKLARNARPSFPAQHQFPEIPQRARDVAGEVLHILGDIETAI